MSSSFIAFTRFQMILDKDGCSAVDLFLVFLQISGENPKKTIVRCTSSLMVSGARGRTHLEM